MAKIKFNLAETENWSKYFSL